MALMIQEWAFGSVVDDVLGVWVGAERTGACHGMMTCAATRACSCMLTSPLLNACITHTRPHTPAVRYAAGPGLYDWSWVNGTLFSASFVPAWGANQPDDAGGVEDCAELGVNVTDAAVDWRDRGCTGLVRRPLCMLGKKDMIRLCHSADPARRTVPYAKFTLPIAIVLSRYWSSQCPSRRRQA